MTTWRDAPCLGARWWYEEPGTRPLASVSAHGGDGMAMHRKYAGWSELRPEPRTPWWREVLEMMAGVALTGLALAGTAAAILGFALLLG